MASRSTNGSAPKSRVALLLGTAALIALAAGFAVVQQFGSSDTPEVSTETLAEATPEAGLTSATELAAADSVVAEPSAAEVAVVDEPAVTPVVPEEVATLPEPLVTPEVVVAAEPFVEVPAAVEPFTVLPLGSISTAVAGATATASNSIDSSMFAVVVPLPVISVPPVGQGYALAGMAATASQTLSGSDLTMPEPAPEPVEDVAAEPVETVVEAVEAAVAAVEGPAISLTQVADSKWFIEMSFRSTIRTSKDDVTLYINGLGRAAKQNPNSDWIEEGISIFSINGEPITGETPIEQLLLDTPDLGLATHTAAVVTYKTENGRSMRNAILSVPVVRHVTLSNGVKLEIKANDGVWQTRVKSVVLLDPEGVRAGDMLVSEAVTGLSLDGSQSLETVMTRLAELQQPEAVFTVLRGDEQIEVKLALATE